MSVSIGSRQPRSPLFFLAIASLAAAVAAVDARGQGSSATFTVLPHFDPSASNRAEQSSAVNNQGIVVGYGNHSDGSTRAVLWAASNTAFGLGPHPDFPNTFAYSLSGNGQVICGSAIDEFFTEFKAFVWTSGQGIRRLEDLWSGQSEARVVSDDGSTAWGFARNALGDLQAVRWNTNTLAVTGIPTISPNAVQSIAFDASANGQFAVGFEATERDTRAVRFTPSGPEFLPRLEPGSESIATGIYPDGSVVVGYGNVDDKTYPFIWSAAGGIRTLPRVTASRPNLANDVAENGTVVGQDGSDQDGTRPQDETAALWIADRGFTLENYLQTFYGIDVSNWRYIQKITGISRDGRVLTGYGVLAGRTRAFRVNFFGNLYPVANAGTDIRKNNAAPSGVNVKLDGRKSRDPDGGSLSYRWSGINFQNNRVARPTAKFPVGTTTVTLRVTDNGAISSTDKVRVIVKAKRSSIRPEGLAANDAFANASTLTATASASGDTNEAALVAAENAAIADALGAALGDAYVWGEDESPEGAAADYGAYRLLQSAYGQAAAASLAQAYLETGDAAYAEAYRSATLGTQRALADLAE